MSWPFLKFEKSSPADVGIRGGHAPSYLYRIVADHYRSEDVEFETLDLDK